MPGKSALEPGVLTIQQSLSFGAAGSYVWNLDASKAVGSSVVTRRVTINNAALFSPTDLHSAILSAGSVFTVINNTAATPVIGAFANLPDASTITVGSNTFQANYEGGDGNDLTLTVVP